MTDLVGHLPSSMHGNMSFMTGMYDNLGLRIKYRLNGGSFIVTGANGIFTNAIKRTFPLCVIPPKQMNWFAV